MSTTFVWRKFSSEWVACRVWVKYNVQHWRYNLWKMLGNVTITWCNMNGCDIVRKRWKSLWHSLRRLWCSPHQRSTCTLEDRFELATSAIYVPLYLLMWYIWLMAWCLAVRLCTRLFHGCDRVRVNDCGQHSSRSTSSWVKLYIFILLCGALVLPCKSMVRVNVEFASDLSVGCSLLPGKSDLVP